MPESELETDDAEGTCRSCGHGIATAHDSDGECWKVGCACASTASPVYAIQLWEDKPGRWITISALSTRYTREQALDVAARLSLT